MRRLALALVTASLLPLAACSEDDGGTIDTGEVTTSVPADQVEPGDTTPTTAAE